MKYSKEIKIVGLIPARLGSNRVKAKNLRIIAGKPLIYYSIRAIKNCSIFHETYVNSESPLIGQVAKRYGMNFYQRPKELATSSSMIDEYIFEFLSNVSCDVLAIINPTVIFLTSDIIEDAVRYFLDHNFDTLLSGKPMRTHCFYNGKPINLTVNGKLPRSQDIIPVYALNFGISVWNSIKFIEQYKTKNYGVFTGNLGFYPLEGLSQIDIDWEDDFILAEILMENLQRFESSKPQYDPILDEIIKINYNTRT